MGVKSLKKLKHVKGCPGCIHFRQYFCVLAGPRKTVPAKMFNTNKCPSRKKNKHIYF